MLTKMMKFELRRSIRKRRPLLLGALCIIALVGGAVHYLGYGTPQRTSLEAFSFSTDLILPLLLPLLAGLATGDALVEDHRLGLLPLVLSRGVSPLQYALAKGVASIVGQVCFLGGVLASFLVIIMPFFPFGSISEYAAYSARDFASSSPVAYCLAMALVYISAAVAFSGVALLFSVWVKNAFVVMVTPVILYFAALYTVGTNTPFAAATNPYIHLALGSFSLPTTLFQAVIYWAVIALATHLLAVLAFSLKRNYA